MPEDIRRLLIDELNRHLVVLEARPLPADVGRRAVHALKGAAGLAEERDLASALQRVERRLREGDESALEYQRDARADGRRAPGPRRERARRRVAGGPPDDLRATVLDHALSAQYDAELRDHLAAMISSWPSPPLGRGRARHSPPRAHNQGRRQRRGRRGDGVVLPRTGGSPRADRGDDAGGARQLAGAGAARRRHRGRAGAVFSLLVITVSFLPVFTLEDQEGRLFRPLAFTKTFSMAGAALLSVTLVPVLMTLFVRGRILPERKNPIEPLLIWAYRPVIKAVLRNAKSLTVAARRRRPGRVRLCRRADRRRVHADAERGTLLYMPVSLPGMSITKAGAAADPGQDHQELPRGRLGIRQGGSRRHGTDPAPTEMFETVDQPEAGGGMAAPG